MFEKIKLWNSRFDILSLLYDFFFVFGILVLNWSPLTIILWFVVDNFSMLFYVLVLNVKEKSDWLDKIGIFGICFIVVSFSVAFLNVFEKLLTGNQNSLIQEVFDSFNIVFIPIFLSNSLLNHHLEYSEELNKMQEGSYKSDMIKHFFLRYFLLIGLLLLMAFSFGFFQTASIIGLIGVRSALRFRNKKFRRVL